MKLFISLISALSFFCYHTDAQSIDKLISTFKTDKQKADKLFYYGTKHYRKSGFDSASWYFIKGFPYAEKAGDAELIAWYITQQSGILFFKKEFQQGLLKLQKAFPYLKKASSVSLQNRVLLLTGRFYENLNRNDSALFYYHQCEQFNNLNNVYDNWLVYYNIAQMFKRADAFDKSEAYFLKAYNLTKPKAIIKDHITVLVEFADLYYLLGMPEKFALLMNEQNEIMRKVKRDFINDPIHSMYFFVRAKEPLEKKVAFMKNVKLQLNKAGNSIRGAEANSYIAQFYEEADQPLLALDYVRENQIMFEKENDFISLYNHTKTAYRLLKKAGKTKQAIAEADRMFSLKDSIILLQQRGLVMDLETKYEIAKKERDIFLLNAENEFSILKLVKETDLKEALIRENLLKDSVVAREKDYNKLLAGENELKKVQLKNEKELKAAVTRENFLKENKLVKEKRIKWLLISGAISLLAFGSVIFFMYSRQRIKNMLIQKQSEDLQMLMKEIHHRVKNNLQVISSLLDLQSLTIKDKHAAEAIKESRNRVYSMALIHQNLYKNADIIGIDMKDYINKLVQSLFQSYNNGENKITLETEIDPVILDVEMVIPIGLVLNELISNSLKYAFKNKDAGVLHIGFKKQNDEMLLSVKDNGAGFPIGMNVFKTSSFGYKLVKAFAQKLKAKLEIYNDNGACILLHIKNLKLTY